MVRVRWLLAFALVSIIPPHAKVRPSTCGCTFIRGDANNDGTVDISDAVLILQYLYMGTFICNLDRADVNDDGAIQQVDATGLLCYIFGEGCPPPQPPFPSSGCDCTADPLENCCSRSQGASQVEYLQVTGVDAQDMNIGFQMWDANVWGPGANPRDLEITTQNDISCAHPETTTGWYVAWTIQDNHGIESDALNSGCVTAIKFDVLVRADYGVGEDCYYYRCPRGLPNALEVSLSPDPTWYEVCFVNPSNPNQRRYVEATTASIDPTTLGIEYCYEETYCVLQCYNEDNTGWISGVVSISYDDFPCWRLKYLAIQPEALQYRFIRLGHPDLVKSEAISPLASAGYSVRLNSIRYVWCQ